jgi:hypothetical protein
MMGIGQYLIVGVPPGHEGSYILDRGQRCKFWKQSRCESAETSVWPYVRKENIEQPPVAIIRSAKPRGWVGRGSEH